MFGPDAPVSFLGKSKREVYTLLGFGGDWIDQSLVKGTLFQFAIFPQSSVGVCVSATWDEALRVLEELYFGVWRSIESQEAALRSTPYAEIDAATPESRPARGTWR